MEASCLQQQFNIATMPSQSLVVLCCAVLCCAVLCCAVLCCAVLCCAGLGWAVLCHAMMAWVWCAPWYFMRTVFRLQRTLSKQLQ